MNYAPEISKYQFFRQKKTYILKKIWCFHVMDARKWIIFNCLRKKYIYVYVVWGSADQAQFWHLLCQTLKHAKKTAIFIVLNYFWFFWVHSWIPCSAAKYKQWRNWVWISYVCTASRAHKTEWFLQSADRNNSGMFWKAPFFNADRGILIFLMFLSENVVNCSIYGKTSLFATLLFFLRSLFSGQKK